ncbi:unnamed protein product [Pedinophyceae sp. YPF-701]|nr:unnamed protein product [Pedinophyceae sp. YPF-701]
MGGSKGGGGGEGGAKAAEGGKYDLDDFMTLKMGIDHVAAEEAHKCGIAEDSRTLWLRMVFGTVGVVTSVWGHFQNHKFPSNYWTIFSCVAVFAACAIGMTVLSWIENNRILTGRADPAVQLPACYVASTFDRNDGTYKLGLGSLEVPGGAKQCRNGRFQVWRAKGVNEFFDVNGRCAEEKARKFARGVVQKFLKGVSGGQGGVKGKEAPEGAGKEQVQSPGDQTASAKKRKKKAK